MKEQIPWTDTSCVRLGVGLLLARDGVWFQMDEAPDTSALQPIPFTIRSLISDKTHYSNIEIEALAILAGLEKFHLYYFMHEVSVITDHKPLVAVFKKDIAAMSHRLQRILLCIHQYNIRILFKQGSQLFLADWIFRCNHTKMDMKKYQGWART